MADHETSAEPTHDKGGSTASVADRSSSAAYSPRAWLVILGLLVGAVVIASVWEPRWWRSLEDALFATEGQIIVSSPAVYTRQRLVNDRLSQTSWLQDQLKVTDGLDTSFRGIDEVRTATNSSATKIAAGIKKAPTVPQSASGETGTTSNPVQDRQDAGAQNSAPINPTSADLFRMKNTYREEVRAEIMETQLDDRHDIRGNTIYRLSFDATILPGLAADALAVIKVVVKHSYEKVIWDYVELYNDWMRRMQSTVAKSIDAIAIQFEKRQPDMRIKLTMSDFVAEKICNPEGAVGQAPATDDCSPDSGSEKLREAKRKLSEFNTVYRMFRLAAFRQKILDNLRLHPKAGNVTLDEIKAGAGNFERYCLLNSPAPKAPVILGNLSEMLECPPTDPPVEGLNGALQVYRHLRNHPFDRIVAAFGLDAEGKPQRCQSDSNCLTAEPPTADYRCFAAEYMWASLNNPHYASEQGRLPISKFFRVSLTGREIGNCNLRFEANWDGDVIRLLASELNNGVELYSYSVMPKNLVQRVATTSDTRYALQALLNANFEMSGQGASTAVENLRKRSNQSQRVQSNPVVVSFGVGRHSYRPTHVPYHRKEWTTQFGWAIAPEFDVDDPNVRSHSEKQYSLAVVVSLPAWWRSVDLDVETCWVRKRDLELNPQGAICPGGQATEAASNGQATEAASKKRRGAQPDVVRLPGALNELSHKLGFEVVDEPRLDARAAFEVETNRPATLLLTGGRIWRSTEVTLGSQKADEIVVLPNMEGILAKFRCVRRPSSAQPAMSPSSGGAPGPNPSPNNAPAQPATSPSAGGAPGPGPSPNNAPAQPATSPSAGGAPGPGPSPNNAPEVEIRVWTSEGVTEPILARLIPPRTEQRTDATGAATKDSDNPRLFCPDELRDMRFGEKNQQEPAR